MGSAVRDLRARAASLAGGTFTLALFGAFSAGKSSFANALLGEAVLPVSPHPTTAAINRIMAPSGGAEHGTARVRMKTPDVFQEDLAYSFRLLGLGEPGQTGKNGSKPFHHRMCIRRGARITAFCRQPQQAGRILQINLARMCW
ncbi:dynamin family protein [Paenibacillus sp. 1A_MP2]|uniref:dynamin family protein n=1 Tax=Paenibacillus sp. 1A_MP2 TaxID=3457495 RepID=UPI003FCE2648